MGEGGERGLRGEREGWPSARRYPANIFEIQCKMSKHCSAVHVGNEQSLSSRACYLS